MMNWNHRVVRVLDYIDEQGNAHYTLTFAEVYYNDDGTPMGHSECFMQGDDLGELRQLVNRLGDAINKDILDERDMKDNRVQINEEIDAEMNKIIGWLPGRADSDEDIFEVDKVWDECPMCGNKGACASCGGKK